MAQRKFTQLQQGSVKSGSGDVVTLVMSGGTLVMKGRDQTVMIMDMMVATILEMFV